MQLKAAAECSNSLDVRFAIEDTGKGRANVDQDHTYPR